MKECVFCNKKFENQKKLERHHYWIHPDKSIGERKRLEKKRFEERRRQESINQFTQFVFKM